MKKNSALKITLWIILGIVGVFLITSIICIILIFQDNYVDKYTIKDTSNRFNISNTLVKAAWKGEETTISDSDLNQWLWTYLDLPKSGKNATLNHLAVHNRINFTDMYFHVTYKGNNFAIYSQVQLSVDTERKKIHAEVQRMKIGELNIPNFLIPNILQKVLSPYNFLSLEGNKITFNSHFSYNSVDIEILELKAVNNGLYIKTNALKREAIEYIEEKIEDAIKDWTDHTKDKVDKFKDSFQDYMDKFEEKHPDEASSLNQIKDNIQTYVEDFKEEHAEEISGLEEQWNNLENSLKDYWNDFKNGIS